MTAAAMKNLSESFGLSSPLPTKQAWAKYVRNRWPENAVGHAQQEWHLSEGRARGLVYGDVTQPTIDQIRAHPRGGLRVILTVEAITWGMKVDGLLLSFIEHEQARLAAEERRAKEDRDAILAMGRSLAVLPGLGPRERDRAGVGRSG